MNIPTHNVIIGRVKKYSRLRNTLSGGPRFSISFSPVSDPHTIYHLTTQNDAQYTYALPQSLARGAVFQIEMDGPTIKDMKPW